ncbi:flagellar basal body P-ring formation chaperone FlgA [Niveibacterium sp. SC-1]|uniref:flagellar basal body P-ring formation chaperone FlgA n=1 Tax=Niveibacterium sp. SC-1 TaxID=3135646 RepID=UPI00311FB0BA
MDCKTLASLFAFCAGALATAPASAQAPTTDLRALALDFLKQEASTGGRTVTVEIPARAQPAPRTCIAPEAFLPQGRRAWGKTTVGVRCREPRWTVYMPAQVRVQGRYLVAARPLASGQTLAAGDWNLAEGDVAALPAGVLESPMQAEGRTLRRAVAASSPLVADQLLATRAVERGQKVQVISRGAGFEVSNQGEALAPAADGQTVTVRLEGGRIVQGVARLGGVVEIRP